MPQRIEVFLRNLCGMNELHVIDIDLFSDQIRLLQASMVVEIDVPINDTELTARKSQMSTQHYALL